MKKFESFSGITAPLPLVNIDTDMIIPKQFLKTIKRTGLGASLFYEMRFDINGQENLDFVLNQPQWKHAEILITGDNFGCGSSREHAPWALLDYGIKCIISTSIADIFYNNCFKNGLLPITLNEDQVNELMAIAKKGSSSNQRLTIDLENQKVILSDEKEFGFEIDSFRKKCLLEGLDDIGLTMKKISYIDDYEVQNEVTKPWL